MRRIWPAPRVRYKRWIRYIAYGTTLWYTLNGNIFASLRSNMEINTALPSRESVREALHSAEDPEVKFRPKRVGRSCGNIWKADPRSGKSTFSSSNSNETADRATSEMTRNINLPWRATLVLPALVLGTITAPMACGIGSSARTLLSEEGK